MKPEPPRCPECGRALDFVLTATQVIQMCLSEIPSHFTITLRDDGGEVKRHV